MAQMCSGARPRPRRMGGGAGTRSWVLGDARSWGLRCQQVEWPLSASTWGAVPPPPAYHRSAM